LRASRVNRKRETSLAVAAISIKKARQRVKDADPARTDTAPYGRISGDQISNERHHQDRFRTIMSVGLAAAFMPATASAQGANQGWYKTCTKQEDNDVCVVQNIVTAPTGQLLTAVGLINVTGKVNRMLLQVTVPTARLIQPGVNLQVDGGQAQRVEYAICMPETCVAETLLTDAMIASFKKGGELVLTSVNYQRTPKPVEDLA
jgi:invasion protein IalB